VIIKNLTSQPVEVSICDVDDRECKGGTWQAPLASGQQSDLFGKAFARKVQVVVWRNKGAAGGVSVRCLAGPKTIFSANNVTIVESDGHTYICNRLMNPGDPIQAVEKIEHIIVLMMENRSFDNLAGWLYRPSEIATTHSVGFAGPGYDGLLPSANGDSVDKRYWNTATASQHDSAPENQRLYVRKVPGDQFSSPTPGPVEVVPGFLRGIFGTDKPAANAPRTMWGFLEDYIGHLQHQGSNANSAQIMACYTPDHLPVFSNLARSFAISDRWFCSIPCQTWPNRSVMHAGTSFGRLNNMEGIDDEGEHAIPWKNFPSNAQFAGKTTIFEALYNEGVRAATYGRSGPTNVSLLDWQFFNSGKGVQPAWYPKPKARADLLADLDKIEVHPNYVFIEPEMFYQLGYTQKDYHPPGDVRGGEQTLHWIYDTLQQANIWHKTLLIITFDESGNCYDHVPPPDAQALPDVIHPQFGPNEIGTVNPFSMYGPRIPTLLISPLIEQKTVFRSSAQDSGGIKPEYDHCAILASIRDWAFGQQNLDAQTNAAAYNLLFLNNRVRRAPTIWQVLDRQTSRAMPQSQSWFDHDDSGYEADSESESESDS
jgi:phospholipase C